MIEEVHGLVGVHAVDAVTAGERDLFEAHLPDCPSCEQEARELAATAALLGSAAWAPTPPQLRTRVMAEITRTRQDRPVLTFPDRRARAVPRRWAAAGAACLAVLGVGLGGYTAHLRSDLTGLQDRDRQVAAVRTAPDARTVSATTAEVTGTVTMSAQTGRLVFLARGLGRLPSTRTYQLWLSGPGGLRSAGTFRPTDERPDTVLLRGPGDARRLMVTEEPAPGSALPTSLPLLQLDVASS